MNAPLVSYEDVRKYVESGDVLLCCGTSLFSRVIQCVTKSPYSHVGLVWLNKEADRVMVYESVESKGVINAPLSRYLGNYNGEGDPYPGEVYIARHAGFKNLTLGQRKSFLQFAIDVQQYPYDSLEIARIAIALAKPDLAWDPGFPEVAAGKRYICSVYAGHTLQVVNLSIPHDPRGFLAPADFPKCPDISVLWRIL